MPAEQSRLITEQLNAAIDLRLCQVSEPHPNVLQIRTKIQGVRILFALLFAVPCLMLLITAVFSPTTASILIALFFCPPMTVLAVLAGLTEHEKLFDRSTRTGTKSLRLFRFCVRESVPLPAKGNVNLSWSLTTGGKANPGSSHKFTVSLQDCPGFTFAVHKDYRKARKFAEKLADFLSLNQTEEYSELDVFYFAFK